MIHLSVITDEISDDFEHALDVAAEYGLRYVELRQVGKTNAASLSPDEIERVKKSLARRGMQVAAIAGPVFKCNLYADKEKGSGDTFQHRADETIEAHVEHLKGSIRAAQALGAGIVRTFAFWRQGEVTDRVIADIAERLRAVLPIVAAAGLKLGLENENSCYIGSGEESARVLRLIPDPHLGLIWDAGNAYHLGEVPFPTGYRAVTEAVGAARIFHVHLKDGRREPATGKRAYCRFGDGEIDFAGQWQALLADGYAGIMSLETHWRHPSGGKEQASRECLAAIRDLTRRLGLADQIV